MKPTFENEQKQADRTSTCEYGKIARRGGIISNSYVFEGLFKYEV